MEESFNRLKKEGKNTVDNLIKWMQESKLMDKSKASEAKVRNLFDKSITSKVEYKTFQEAVGKIAAEQMMSSEDLFQKLVEEATRFSKAAASTQSSANASSFKDSTEK